MFPLGVGRGLRSRREGEGDVQPGRRNRDTPGLAPTPLKGGFSYTAAQISPCAIKRMPIFIGQSGTVEGRDGTKLAASEGRPYYAIFRLLSQLA